MKKKRALQVNQNKAKTKPIGGVGYAGHTKQSTDRYAEVCIPYLSKTKPINT
jgi:hypothetical protein